MAPNELFQQLYGLKGKQYEIHKRGLPDSARRSISALCELLEDPSHNVREEIVSLVTRGISFLFLVFSEAMAIEAVQRCDKQSVVRGLEALAIENCVGDWRDSTLRLALLYHSGAKINAEPEKLIRDVTALAMQAARDKLFSPFLERVPEDRQLAKFGLKEGRTPQGEFTYVSG